VVNIN